MRLAKRALSLALTGFVAVACNTGGSTSPPPACDVACQDAIAVRAFREIVKQVFNGAIQNQPVGAQDVTYTCAPLGGTAHITGTATANADLGTTTVDLTYAFDHCRYLRVDTDPNQTYDMTLTGSTEEKGIIAQQPGSTTSLAFTSASASLSGTVYAPPIDYSTTDADAAAPDDDGGAGCAVALSQNGNDISGTICGRTAGVSL